MHSLTAVLLGAFAALHSHAAPPALDPAEVAARHTLTCPPEQTCSPSLAKLIVLEDDGTEIKCTGFLIGSKLLATNRHCLPDSLVKGRGACGPRILAQFAATAEEPAEVIPCKRVVARSPLPPAGKVELLDYAVLELTKAPGRPALTVSAAGVKAGTDLTLLQINGLEQSTIGTDTCQAVTGSLQWPFTTGPSSPTLTLQGCAADHGHSGAPLLNGKGEVVALLEGVSGQKNYEYFKEHFPGASFTRVQKASNLSCIALPGAKKRKLPKECGLKREEADLLREGNALFQGVIENALPGLKKASFLEAGLRWDPHYLFRDGYAPEQLRPDNYRLGPVPRCISNRKALMDRAKPLTSGSGRYQSYKLLKSPRFELCDVDFQFSPALQPQAMSAGPCKTADYLVSIGRQGRSGGLTVRVLALDELEHPEAWREVELKVCGAR